MLINFFRRVATLGFQTSKFHLRLNSFKCDAKTTKHLTQKIIQPSNGNNGNINQKQEKNIQNQNIQKRKSVVGAYSDSANQNAVIFEISYLKDQSPENQLFVEFFQNLAQRTLRKIGKWYEIQYKCQQKTKNQVEKMLKSLGSFYEQYCLLNKKLEQDIRIRRLYKICYDFQERKYTNNVAISVDKDIEGGIGKQAIMVSVLLHCRQYQNETYDITDSLSAGANLHQIQFNKFFNYLNNS